MAEPERSRRRPGRPAKAVDASASALARLGSELRRLRLEQGLTLIQAGELTGYSWQHLSAVERAGIVPAEDVVVACERALASGGRLISLYPAVVREQAAERHAREAARRAAAHLSEPEVDWGRLAATAIRSEAVTADMVEELELITDRQRSLYHELTSAQMLVPVEAHLGLLMSLLKSAQGSPVRHRIASAAAEAAGFAAWIWYDLGDEYKMAQHYRTANGLLAEAEHPALGAYVGSYQSLACDAGGLTDEAIAHAEWALDTAPETISKLTRSWLCVVAASALAPAPGRRAEALALLGQARDHFDVADGREDWMYDFDQTALAGSRGHCHLRLGQPAAAISAFTEGLAALPATCERRGAQFSVGLAEAHLAAGDAEEAVSMAARSLEVFATRGSVSGLRRVQRLRDLLHNNGHKRHAARLDEQVRARLKAAP